MKIKKNKKNKKKNNPINRIIAVKILNISKIFVILYFKIKLHIWGSLLIKFEIIDILGNKIVLSKNSFEHIVSREEMASQEEKIKETLKFPDIIKLSKYDKRTFLYYRFFEDSLVGAKYLVVIVKKLQKESFIVTSFYTDKIKVGDLLWQKWKYGMMKKEII